MKKIKTILIILLLTNIFAAGAWALPAGGFSGAKEAWALPADEFPVTKEGTDVLIVLAGQNKQPHPTFTTDKDNLDTVWIFFANGDFRQFVIMDQEIRMFSCGTYSQDPDGRFHVERTQKYMEGAGFQDYHSVHEYVLNAREYVTLVKAGGAEQSASTESGNAGQTIPAEPDNDGQSTLSEDGEDAGLPAPSGIDSDVRKVDAIFWKIKQPVLPDDDQAILPDTLRIYYSDQTFDEYAAFELAVSGDFQLGQMDSLNSSDDILLYKRTE